MFFRATIIFIGILFWQPVSLAGEPTKIYRLFTTPTERAELNNARKRYMQGIEVEEPEEGGDISFSKIKFDGILMRNGRNHEVWLNGQRGLDENKQRGLSLKAEELSNKQIRVSLPNGDQVKLSPGQVYNLENGEAMEGYQAIEDLEVAPEEEISSLETPNIDAENTEKEKQSTEEIFDEAILVEQIVRIKLLEERINKLEKGEE